MIVRAVLVKRGKILYKNIDVPEEKYLFVKKTLDFQRNKIVDILKRMKKDQMIRSIYAPANKRIQKELNELVKAKRVIKKSMRSLTDFYT